MLLRAEDAEGACSRAYYAMFDAAHAALWASGARENGAVIKTHSGLVAAFGEGLVKTGKMTPAHGRALARALKTRLLADYTSEIVPIDEAGETIALAEQFVRDVTAFIGAL
jgi:uncharacterized protein (UPF0332 family)